MSTTICTRCSGSGRYEIPHYTGICPDCAGKGWIEQDSGASGSGDAFPWIMASVAGIYAWSKTRDQTTTAVAFIAVAAFALNKYGRVICVAALVWGIAQVLMALT